MAGCMVDLEPFVQEQTPFGEITLATGTPHGATVLFTGTDFAGRLGEGVADSLSSWIRERFGIEAPLSTCHQVHGTTIRRIEPAGQWRELEACDGLWSDEPRSALAIKVADCIAVVMLDRVSGVSLAFHAGWRGAAAGIVTRSLEAASAESQFTAANASAWIGPAIRQCCFEVGEEVIDAIGQGRHLSPAQVDRSRGERPYLDLAGVVVDELRAAGVPGDSIHDFGACTRCSGSFHSYRRDPSRGGRNLAVIAVDREKLGRRA